MKKIIILSFLFFVSILVFAQKETNWWYFGRNVGLNFNILQNVNSSTGILTMDMPTPVTGPLNAYEGCFTLSDANGNLLMSSNGMTVYNKNNTVMVNGSGLLGGDSSTQSGIVVPVPGSPDKFYVISVAQDQGANGITYSIVDMSLTSGLGAVTSTKNVKLLAGPTDENIAAIRHANGVDYWLMHRRMQNNLLVIYVWAVTSSGIAPSPAIYNLSGIPGYGSTTYLGYLKFTSDGSRFATPLRGTGHIVSGFFDTQTGIPSDIKSRQISSNTTLNGYSVEFSPSGEQLYLGVWAGSSNNLYQISWDDLRNTTKMAYQYTSYPINTLQISPDGRIYGIQDQTRNLFVIMNPEATSGNADIRVFTNFLTANAAGGLPTFAASFFNAKASEKSFVCAGNDFEYIVEITMSGALTDQPTILEWDFGDGTTTVNQTIVSGTTTYNQPHNYAVAGKYTITITPYKADGTALAKTTLPTNVVDCVFKTNRMIRTDLLNTAQQQ